jgi:hypothetical protein
MRLALTILGGLALTISVALPAASTPTYSHGVVTCPDGGKGPLHVARFTSPTAAQLSGVCLSLQAKKLQPKPLVPGQHPMSRDEINQKASGLVGPPHAP